MSEKLSEALGNIGEAVSETIEENTEAAVEAAQAQTAVAERTAEQIAAAAMESERGRELSELRKDFNTWRDNQSSIQTEVQNLQSSVTALTAQIQTLLNPPVTVQLTPPISEPPAPPVTTIVEEIAETASDQSANIENAVLPPKRVKRFL